MVDYLTYLPINMIIKRFQNCARYFFKYYIQCLYKNIFFNYIFAELITKMSIYEDSTYHCQTQLKQDRFCYTWNIVDFWNIYKYKIDLYSKARNNFRFRMSSITSVINEENLNFYCWIDHDKNNTVKSNLSKARDICYSVLIKIDEQVIRQDSLKHIYMKDKEQYILCSLSMVYLKKNFSSNITLTVNFEFFTFDKMLNNNIYYSYKRLASMTDMHILAEKPDSPVVIFVIDQQRLKANKNLLCLNSKVFEAMFNDLKESNEIQITDTEYDILKELLFFVETGYLSERLNDTNASVSVLKLFLAADKYDIQDLKLICEQHLIICTTVQNVVEHLKMAYLNNGKILAKYAKSFIKLYLKVIMDTPEFVTLIQMYPELLTEIKTMQIDDEEV